MTVMTRRNATLIATPPMTPTLLALAMPSVAKSRMFDVECSASQGHDLHALFEFAPMQTH